MWSALKTLAIALCAQQCAGQLVVRVVRGVGDDHESRVNLPKSASSARRGDLISKSDGALAIAGESGHDLAANNGIVEPQRELRGSVCRLIVEIIIAIIEWALERRLQAGEAMEIEVNFVITDPDNGPTNITQIVSVDSDGVATASMDLTDSQVNDDGTALCDECTLDVVAGECVSGDCAAYDMDATNDNLEMDSSVSGDPHMVGLLGQKIDWYGKDNQWYCLISDSSFHVNVRVNAPMPEEFPNRQLVTGVSILTGDGHSLVIEVKDPYTTDTEGCPGTLSKPCLLDGALRILVDGRESHSLQSGAENIALSGGMAVSSGNLPAECQPFGGDRIWAAQFAADHKMASAFGRRSLRAPSTRFNDWLLEAETIAAPTWCAKFLNEQGTAGISHVQSSHAILRVEMATVTIRVNIGVNYQDLVNGPDGTTVLVPELDFWQTDLGFEGLQLSGDVGGLLGDTSRLVMDKDGVAVTSGPGALHGSVESYRVAGSVGVDYKQLHANRVY